jgi:hypothetical protein
VNFAVVREETREWAGPGWVSDFFYMVVRDVERFVHLI